MRRIMNITYMSLDGLTEQMEHWHYDLIDDELTKHGSDLLATCDALVLGRKTFEGFAETWPSETSDIADKLNSMKKYVASTTLQTADQWTNSTLIKGDLVEEIAKIKQEPGQNIMMYGFGPVARTLVQHGLLDELHLGVHPVLAGRGELSEMLFHQGTTAKLELIGTHALASGVIFLTYRPV